MLKGINPILGPDLLYTLRAMGHGDEIALVDGNYPALEHGRRVIRADGLHLIPVLDAVLSVMPIDDFVAQSIFRSVKMGDVAHREPVHVEIDQCCHDHAPERPMTPLAGDIFYNRVRAAHTIVATSEPRLFANVILRKGVISL